MLISIKHKVQQRLLKCNASVCSCVSAAAGGRSEEMQRFVSENLSTFQTGTVDVTVALCFLGRDDNIHCIFVSVMFKTPADPFRNTFVLPVLSITEMKSQQLLTWFIILKLVSIIVTNSPKRHFMTNSINQKPKRRRITENTQKSSFYQSIINNTRCRLHHSNTVATPDKFYYLNR